MEGNKKIKKKCLNDLSKNIVLNIIDLQENLSILDLSNRNISRFSDNINFPINVMSLNLANNNLTEVPQAVINLNNLKVLDLSHNMVQYFDDLPAFCQTIELLNISYNKLEGPPLWIWTERPENLVQLNLSNNKDLCKSFTNAYFKDLLEYTTPVTELDIHNCKLSSKHIKLFSTFRYAKIMNIGYEDNNHSNYHDVNHIEDVPCTGLDQCCDIESLNVSNTHIYTIEKTIDMYKNLIEINLAHNYLPGLPNEFCNLANLQICILSDNKLLYLPDNIHNLTKLVRLHLNSNELCILPETFHELPGLKTLDLYDNHLCEQLKWIDRLEKYDCAQNYFEEPNDDEYLLKKQKMREYHTERTDGRKPELVNDDSEYSRTDSDDEELRIIMENTEQNTEAPAQPNSGASTPEDWDSDDYWLPQYYKQITHPCSPWLIFVKKKMEEGNFCPMDVHPISVADRIKYERQINPPTIYESDGQFDDYSEDDT